MKIKIHNKLPQWIISSDVGAYQPSRDTIHFAKYNDAGNKISTIRRVSIFIHELCHWMICRLNLNKKWHRKIDGEIVEL